MPCLGGKQGTLGGRETLLGSKEASWGSKAIYLQPLPPFLEDK
jgi:hypothetical protein